MEFNNCIINGGIRPSYSLISIGGGPGDGPDGKNGGSGWRTVWNLCGKVWKKAWKWLVGGVGLVGTVVGLHGAGPTIGRAPVSAPPPVRAACVQPAAVGGQAGGLRSFTFDAHVTFSTGRPRGR